MAEPTQAEVMPKVIVRERLPAAPATSAETMAKNITQKLDEGAWRQGLEIAKGAPQEGKITGKIGQIEDAGKRAEAQTAANLAKKFLENGYDGMTNLEKIDLQKAVLTGSGLSKLIASELAGMTSPQKVAYAERLLKDPGQSAQVKKILEELIDPEKKLLDLAPAEEEREKAKIVFEDASAEKSDHQRIRDINDKRLAQYEERIPLGGGRAQKGEKLKQLESIEKNVKSTQVSLNTWQNNLSAAQSDVKRLSTELSNLQRLRTSGLTIPPGARTETQINADIAQARLAETTAQQEVTQLDGKLKELGDTREKLEQERLELIEKQRELDKEKREIERKIKTAETEFKKREKELLDRKTLRAIEEQDLVDGFKNIFKDATAELINQQIEEASKKFDAEIATLKQQTADQNEKALYDTLGKRYIRRGDPKRRIDRRQVDRDFATLIDSGPERLIKILLERSIKDSVNNVSYTNDEVEELLSNKEYMAKVQPEVVKQLLAKKILSGGLRSEDINIISSAQWGKDMIEKALDLNDEFRKNVEDAMGEGAVNKHGFFERFAQELKKHPWWLALLLLPGLAVLGVRAASMSPTEEAIST